MGALNQFCGCKEKPEEIVLFQEKKSSRREDRKNTDKNLDNTADDSKSARIQKLFSEEELKALDNLALKIQKSWKAVKLKTELKVTGKSGKGLIGKVKKNKDNENCKHKSSRQNILHKFKNIVDLINNNIEKQGQFIPNQEFLNKMPEKIFKTYSKFFQKEPLNMSFSPKNTYRIRRNSLFCYEDRFIYKGQWTPSGEKDGFGVLLGNEFLVQGFWKLNDLYYGMKIYLNGDYYIGQISNYKANGDGKFYKQNSDLVYEGNFKDDKFQGMGKVKLQLVDPTGFFRNLIGIGQDTDTNGKKDDKSFDNNETDKNNNKSKNENFNSICSNNNFNNGVFYKGEFDENTITGKGKLHLQNYLKYEGDFVDGKFNGDGKLIFLFNETPCNNKKRNNNNNNNNIYYSKHNNDNYDDINSNQIENNNNYNNKPLVNSDHNKSNKNNDINKSLNNLTLLKKTKSMEIENDEYTGEFVNNAISGHGIYVWKTGEYFEGSFYDNKREDSGILSFPSCIRFETCWKNDFPGPADKTIVTDEDGKLLSNEFYKLGITNTSINPVSITNSGIKDRTNLGVKYFEIPKMNQLLIPEIYYDYPNKYY